MKSVAWLIADNIKLGMSLHAATWQAGLEPKAVIDEHTVELTDGGKVEHYYNDVCVCHELVVKNDKGEVYSTFVG